MCGIAGKITFGAKNIGESEILRMTEVIRHRGPDDGGVYISPDHKVGLGSRRLSIIDLSPAGHMPMNYQDKYWITYNGEIYNFQSERKKLVALGYRFRSNSDTEVILALYDKYGVKCLDHLRGMFAFALYDRRKNILFCARDRVGKKPFKYFHNGSVFLFASELKAILTQAEYHREPDYEAIHHYLTLQYCPAPFTGFVGIKKLEPAHYLLLDIAKNKLTTHQYWHLDYSQKLDLSEEEWCRRIMDKLEDSVKLRMISDVPLGAFLSGGIDSSAVVALMARNSSRPVKTFSIGFEESKYNELPYARQVARQFGTDHTEFIVKPDTIEILPFLVRQYEEPYADSSALATYFVSKLTRRHVTVALSGDGGDENFAGYPWYPVHKFSLFYEKVRFLNNLLAVPFWKYVSHRYPTTLTDRGLRFSRLINGMYSYRYLDYIAYFTSDMKQQLYTDGFKDRFSFKTTNSLITQKFSESNTRDKIDQALYTDINSYLPDDLLVKLDIASMSVSLESRSPFLDRKFIEFSSMIPANLKLKGFTGTKYILKKALGKHLPDTVIKRKKMGFMVPLEYWFRGDLKGYLRHNLLSPLSKISSFTNKEYVSSLIYSHYHTGINQSSRLWSLLTLELWLKEYFSGQ